jgi:aconitate hydratase 2/2-methylisocitrate dehydratase
LPTTEEYMKYMGEIDTMAPEIYRYLNFDKMPDFTAAAEEAKAMEIPVKVA